MKVSFIVPIFNLSEMAVHTLQSLVSQSIPDDCYEVIAIDDFSTDDTWGRVVNWKSSLPSSKNVRLYRNPQNLGLKATMRRLLESTSKKFICYVDGDDLVSEEKIGLQLDYMLNNPDCTISYHESQMFESKSGRHLKYYTREHYNFEYLPQKGTVEHLLKYSTFMQASSVMIRNSPSLIDALEHKNEIICDYPWHIGILARDGGTIDYIPNVLGKYRIHDLSFGAKTKNSPERREKVAHELAHAIDLAANFEHVSPSWIKQGKAQTYFAAALYFLREGNKTLFESMLRYSLADNSYFDERHRFLADNASNFHLCKKTMEERL